jgi:excisionase family DNA binding protein
MESLMTVKEVMALTRLSRSKIYQLKDQGILPAVKLAGCAKVLFAPDMVRYYLEAGRTTPSQASACQ